MKVIGALLSLAGVILVANSNMVVVGFLLLVLGLLLVGRAKKEG